MTPRLESPPPNNGHDKPETLASSVSPETVIIQPPGQPAYVRCASQGDFVNPFPDGELPAHVKNERLNLNLGQTVVTPENKLLLWILKFLNDTCVGWWEKYFFELWKRVPLTIRRKLTFWGWKLYLPLHKALLGRRTGLHQDASAEYHALTTIMWWGRLFPVSVQRMRFSLGQLHVISPSPVQSKVRPIQDHDMRDFLPINAVPQAQKEHVAVNGLFLETSDQPTEWTIFWIYGGAFMSGDARGNTGPADEIGRACHMDVFIPECTYNRLWSVKVLIILGVHAVVLTY